MIIFEETKGLENKVMNHSKLMKMNGVKVSDSRYLIDLAKIIIEKYQKLSNGTRKELMESFTIKNKGLFKWGLIFDYDDAWEKVENIFFFLTSIDGLATNVKAKVYFEEFDENKIRRVIFDVCEK